MLTQLEFKQIKTALTGMKKWHNSEYCVDLTDLKALITTYVESDKNQFDLCEEDYEDGMQYIFINEKGEPRFELWQWKDPIDYNDVFRKLIDSEVSPIALYKVIKKHAQLIKKAKTWKEIRK